MTLVSANPCVLTWRKSTSKFQIKMNLSSGKFETKIDNLKQNPIACLSDQGNSLQQLGKLLTVCKFLPEIDLQFWASWNLQLPLLGNISTIPTRQYRCKDYVLPSPLVLTGCLLDKASTAHSARRVMSRQKIVYTGYFVAHKHAISLKP